MTKAVWNSLTVLLREAVILYRDSVPKSVSSRKAVILYRDSVPKSVSSTGKRVYLATSSASTCVCLAIQIMTVIGLSDSQWHLRN
jgi:hypothetical protein